MTKKAKKLKARKPRASARKKVVKVKRVESAVAVPMSREEYRESLDTLGLSIVGAVKLGISRRQSQRLAAGQMVPQPVSKLIRLMVKHKIKPDELE